MIRRIAAVAALAALPAWAEGPQSLNDYPTEARADYVFACMAVNGRSREVLGRCSCAIDTIATILTYDQYTEAEATLSILQIGGERVAAMRNSPDLKLVVSDLRRAQAEADIRCF